MAAPAFISIIDQAVRATAFTRFKDILGITDLYRDTAVFPKDIALRKVAENRGNLELEFLNVWRDMAAPDMSRQRTPLARRGLPLGYSDGTKTGITQVKTMPVHLEYNIWFWSMSMDKLNEVAESYIFWQQDNPNISVMFNGIYPLEMDINFLGIFDESPVEQMYEGGKYFVYRARIGVDGWIFSEMQEVGVVRTIIVNIYTTQNGVSTLVGTDSWSCPDPEGS